MGYDCDQSLHLRALETTNSPACPCPDSLGHPPSLPMAQEPISAQPRALHPVPSSSWTTSWTSLIDPGPGSCLWPAGKRPHDVLHWWWIWTDWVCHPALPFETQWGSHLPAVSRKWEPTLKLRSASDQLNHSAWCKGQVRGGMLRLDEDYASPAPCHQKVNNLSV